MDITIRTADLRSAINRAKDIVSDKKGTMPILSSLLLEAEITPEGGRLTVRAYDLEVGLCSQHACQVKKPGTVAVPGKAFNEIVKALSDADVRLKAGTNNKLEISSGAASFRLSGLPAEDFPHMPDVGDAKWEAVDADVVRTALDCVVFAMSSDETRYMLNGVHAASTPDGLDWVATDGHRMSLYRVKDDKRYGVSAGVIIPRKAAVKLRELLGEGKESNAEVAFTENSLAYRRAGLTYTARLIDGTFPAYGQVIPPPSEKPLLVARVELLKALQRVMLLVDRAQSVTFEVGGGKIKLTTRSPDMGDASDEVSATNAEGEIKLALNGSYLVEMLSSCGSDHVWLHVVSGADPVLVVPERDANHTYVLMPMRM